MESNPKRKAVFASDSNVTQSRWMCLQGRARRRKLYSPSFKNIRSLLKFAVSIAHLHIRVIRVSTGQQKGKFLFCNCATAKRQQCNKAHVFNETC